MRSWLIAEADPTRTNARDGNSRIGKRKNSPRPVTRQGPVVRNVRAGLTGREAAPVAEQIEAPLIAAAAKAQKPSFPAGEVERAAAVFAVLVDARGALDAASVARGFRQGAKVEPAIARILASLARLGHAHTADARTFALRRRA